jgi:hypothetical protein
VLVLLAELARAREGVVAHFGEVAGLSLADPWFGLVVEATTGEEAAYLFKTSDPVCSETIVKVTVYGLEM